MMNKKHLIGEGFKHVFLMTLSLLCVFPFYWMIVGMTNSSADITMGKLTFGNKLAENVTNAFNYSNLWRAFGNSLLLAVIVTGIGLLICSIAGYAFVVFPSRGKEILFLALIASMMVPFAAKLLLPGTSFLPAHRIQKARLGTIESEAPERADRKSALRF